MAPLDPKATSSIVNGRSIPWLRTGPDSGTAGWRQEPAGLCQGPHGASLRARTQPSKRPAGTAADSWGIPCQLITSAETAPRNIDCSIGIISVGIGLML